MKITETIVNQNIILICDDFNPDEIIPLFEKTASRSKSIGRGQINLIESNHNNYVLRHYYRGGFFKNLLKDRYFYLSKKLTRSWRELHLLAYLKKHELPIPTPVACRISKKGLFYQADLLMVEISNALSLSKYLETQELSHDLWQQIGMTIKKFHLSGLYHADLNAHNILIDSNQKIWLVDFDRCQIKKPANRWQMNNLKRLRRSLSKLLRVQPFNFTLENWHSLMHGYAILTSM